MLEEKNNQRVAEHERVREGREKRERKRMHKHGKFSYFASYSSIVVFIYFLFSSIQLHDAFSGSSDVMKRILFHF